MIGGYIFFHEDPGITDRLNKALKETYTRILGGDNGFLFHDNPFSDFSTTVYASESLTMLSQDLLVTSNSDGEYSLLNLHNDFPDLFLRKKAEALHDIVSDYRLIVIERKKDDTDLYLVSNRAGNGRMYYSTTESSILFSSDLRFLLSIVPFEVNEPAVYAILKYGATPEPMTISQNIAVVPPAHYLRYSLKSGTCQTHIYFQFEFPCDTRQHSIDEFDTLLQPAKHALRKSAQFLRQQNPAILISGGIDSSLYASYLHEFDDGNRLHGINCAFGDDDPEFIFARMLADKINAYLHIGKMEQEDALALLNDTVALTGHPFSDFSSLPIVFILKFMKDHVKEACMLIEGNGGDDCFGFPDLGTQSKMQVKHRFPKVCKDTITLLFKNSKIWKWTSKEGFLARVLALADNHEINLLNYFLVFSPVNFLGLGSYQEWDRQVNDTMDGVFSRCGKDHDTLSYEAKLTIRQLLHINSRQWAAKAFSVGESLGIRVIYPYIWRDILTVQGTIPWEAKIHNGVVKWPLKRLLEEFMPKDFIYRPKSGFVPPFVQWLTSRDFNQTVRDILLASDGIIGQIVASRVLDELLDDALQGKNLRFPVLNFLWGALFTEMWIQKYKSGLRGRNT
jgi:asparagine synthase (glutamine-hydrolysing)